MISPMKSEAPPKIIARPADVAIGRDIGGCSNCAHLQSCLSKSLSGSKALSTFEGAIEADRVIDAGERLIVEGDIFTALYVVKSGSFKAIAGANPANIMGFYFATNLVGLESIGKGAHLTSYIALERSVVCQLNYQKLLERFRRFPSVRIDFTETMSAQFNESLLLFSLIRAGTVLQRVGAFLLYVAAQNDRRKLVDLEIVLPMGRTDISNFLGISPESLSRSLTTLSKKSLLKVLNRRVTLLDRAALAEIVAL